MGLQGFTKVKVGSKVFAGEEKMNRRISRDFSGEERMKESGREGHFSLFQKLSKIMPKKSKFPQKG